MRLASAIRVRPVAPGAAQRRGEIVRFGDRRGGSGTLRLDSDRLLLLGAWLSLAPVLMLFLSLASAYVVRSGLAPDWSPVPVPPILWVNSGVLVASSAVLEIGRAPAPGGRARLWVGLAFGLGVAFLVGQVEAWRRMLASGIGLASTPHASFLYVLSGTHAVHLVVGVAALAVAALWPEVGRMRLSRDGVLRATAVYWHFLDVVWLGLFALLVFRR